MVQSIGVVGSMSNSTGTGVGVTSITCDIHAEAKPGHLGIWMIVGQTATAPASSPVGWSLFSNNSTTAVNLQGYYRFLDGTETTTQTSGTLTSARTATQMVILSGVQSAVSVAGSSTNGTTATTFAAITPTIAGSYVLALGAENFAAGTSPGTLATTNLSNLLSVNTTAAATANVLAGFGIFAWTSGAFTPNMSNSAATARTTTNRYVLTPLPDAGVRLVMAPPIGA